MYPCPKCSAPLEHRLAKNSVILDVCARCKGVWFDAGELGFFVKDKKALAAYEAQGLEGPKASPQSCPKCKTALRSGKIPGFRYEVEECGSCKGLFLDEHEFRKIGELASPAAKAAPLSTAKLPSLGLTSIGVMGLLYGLLIGVMVFLVEMGILQDSVAFLVSIAFILIQFMIGPFIMDWSLSLFGSISWVSHKELPAHLAQFIESVCAKERIPIPRFGIIEDGSPQAYTYGRTPKSARVVISRGLLSLLNPKEVEAVVAHEMGHIIHWDFVIMTLAQIVPILLYHAYRLCRKVSRSPSRGKRDPRAAFAAAAIVAYVAYWISTYLVMLVSRTREYWADLYSAETTRDPNSLVSALTKIAFGLLNARTDEQEGGEQKRMAVQSLGIMNISSSKELALYHSQGGGFTSKDLQEVMKWDLWNPWALYFELHSTHPLTAKRINALSSHARAMGIEPAVVFDQKKPENYWDDFSRDLVILALPLIGGAIGFGIGLQGAAFHYPPSSNAIALLFLGLSLGGILKTLMIYPGAPFLGYSISSLLKMIKVSPVRAYPVKLRGHVIGRGDAGYIFSEDMVLQDKSGIIYMDYEQGIGILNLVFALMKLKRFRGTDVEVLGWYRRAPIPYIEVKEIRSREDVARSYLFYWKLVGWALVGLVFVFLKHSASVAPFR